MTRKASSSAPIVVIAHVPNTGGLSLQKTVIRHLSPPLLKLKNLLFRRPLVDVQTGNLLDGRILQIDNRKTLREHIASARPNSLRVIQGHCRFGVHVLFSEIHGPSNRPFVYISMLREPADRVVSLYYYWRDELPQDLEKEDGSGLMNLEEWLDSEKFRQVVKNSMTQFLAGAGGPEYYNFQPATEPYDEAMLETAKANMERHFALVGIMEQFDESLLLMQPWLGWRLPCYVKTSIWRKRASRPPLPPETRTQVEQLNQLDIALYAYAKERFARQIEAQGSLFNLKLKLFQQVNKLVTSFYIVTYTLRSRLSSLPTKPEG